MGTSKDCTSPQVVTIDNNGARKQYDERESTHSISRHFFKETKFTRKLEEDSIEYTSSYKEAYGDYFLHRTNT